LQYFKKIVKPSVTGGGPDDVTYVTPDGRCIPEDLNNSDWVELKTAIDAADATEVPLEDEWPAEALPPPPAPPRPRPSRNPDGTLVQPPEA